MKIFLCYIILLLLSFYWYCTICFNLPDNYINLSSLTQSKKFKTYFFQHWSFFAPPPKANEKAYLIFYSKKNTSSISFEILQSLYKSKQRKIPFNWNEDILDYIISNSVISISTQIVDINNIKKYLKESKTPLTDSIKNSLSIKQIQNSKAAVTLVNYSKIIAKENFINIDNYELQIKLTRQSIPKFTDRLEFKIHPSEEIYYQSEKIDFRNEKN